jgi:hypothetical protein
MGFDNMPSGCRKWLLNEGIEIDGIDGGITIGGLFAILGVLILANALIFIIYKNYIKKEIEQEMKT